MLKHNSHNSFYKDPVTPVKTVDPPKTGDSNHILPSIIGFAVAAAGLGLFISRKKKEA